MFEAEADGLRELRAAGEIRVPEVFDCGVANGSSFIAMERLALSRPSAGAQRLCGERLAALHRHSRDRYGWFRDNTIGMTPQENAWADEWIAFFRERRLGFQLELARRQGFSGALQELGAGRMETLPDLFDAYVPEASLLHGDLWAGNWGAVDGEPVIFDPAVYYGDRESDLAMTRLFGGFDAGFYAAYEASWPLADGHERRLLLYQLYHVLNHLNLFGRSYLGQALTLLRTLV